MKKILDEILILSKAVYVNNQVKEVLENIYKKHQGGEWTPEHFNEIISLCTRYGITPDFKLLVEIYKQSHNIK